MNRTHQPNPTGIRKQHQCTFEFAIPTVHAVKVLRQQKNLFQHIEKENLCGIFVVKDDDKDHSVIVTAANADNMRAACTQLLRMLSASQECEQKVENARQAERLRTFTILAAINLLQLFQVTFSINYNGVVTFKSWSKKRLDLFLNDWKSNLDIVSEGTCYKEPAPHDNTTKTEEENNQKGPQSSTVGLDCSSFPKCMNILLLGETGVGKSTFINGLINHMKFSSLQEALKSEPEILIRSKFTITKKGVEKLVLVEPPTRNSSYEETEQNENTTDGQSATQKPQAYVFEYIDNYEDKEIRIIDTPGIGDSRGTDYDKININNILTYIAEYKDLHAICILLHPNKSRETLAFRFCLDELLVHLHKSASRNIIFCFTNTRGTFYEPGDTLATLREHLRKLQKDRTIDIPLNENTMFSFDNESFRFLCASKQGVQFTPKQVDDFSSSWTNSVDETARLFNRIATLPVHKTNDTLCLNNIRQAILALSAPLAMVAKLHDVNESLTKDKIDEVTRLANNGKLLKQNLNKKQLKYYVEEIPYPITVCTSRDCVQHERLGDNPGDPLQTIYKTVCHNHCHLEGVQAESVPNPILQGCYCMIDTDQGRACRFCKCLWSAHMHLRYKFRSKMEDVVDQRTLEELNRNDDKKKVAEKYIASLNRHIAELQQEKDRIKRCAAQFSSFLANNSIIPYNDSLLIYLNYLIKEERDKALISGNHEILIRLEKHRDEYQQQVHMLKENIARKAETVCSIKEVHQMISELEHLKHSGDFFKTVKEVEMRSVRETKLNTEKRISASSWIQRKTQKFYTSVFDTTTRAWSMATSLLPIKTSIE